MDVFSLSGIIFSSIFVHYIGLDKIFSILANCVRKKMKASSKCDSTVGCGRNPHKCSFVIAQLRKGTLT